MHTGNRVQFSPQLYIQSGVTDISFYTKAFGAVEIRRFTNDDGSIHVAELSLDGLIFHLHEDSTRVRRLSPLTLNGCTVQIGLFVDDVDGLMKQALAAGAIEISPVQDYDYGYRQGELRDPFGHHWMIEKKI